MDEGRRRWWLSEGRWRARGDGMVEMIERVAGLGSKEDTSIKKIDVQGSAGLWFIWEKLPEQDGSNG